MKKKFIKLEETEKITLQEGHKNGKTKAFQERCHCLLLSSRAYQVKELAQIFRVSEISIYSWFKRWEEGGICGLRNRPGRGRRAILRAEDLTRIKQTVQENAQQLTIKTEFVVECLDEWLMEKNEKPRVLVLDNDGIHRSKKMQSKLAEWEEKGFYIFNLPVYSAHLTIIEILWRKMKYEWLKPKDYLSFENLTTAIKEILSNVGTEYKINFQDRVFIK